MGTMAPETVATFDVARLRSLVERGLLTGRRHPERDLWVWNYTAKAQHGQVWSPELLACRGLVLDVEGGVVARPFPKFFNLGEHAGPLPEADPEVYEKLDGSLVVVARHEGEPLVTTRGAFGTKQAAWARELIETEHGWGWLPEGVTYCFELIHPRNRIVVDYGSLTRLVVLSAIDTATGREGGWDDYPGHGADRHPFAGIADLRDQSRPNAEGYVLFWRDAGLRLKVKHAEYVRLHRIVTGATRRRVWEAMRDGTIQSWTNGTPEGFSSWARSVEALLFAAMQRKHAEVETVHRTIRAMLPDATRADYAAAVAAQPRWLHPILFRMWDGKSYLDLLWEAVRPESDPSPGGVDDGAGS